MVSCALFVEEKLISVRRGMVRHSCRPSTSGMTSALWSQTRSPECHENYSLRSARFTLFTNQTDGPPVRVGGHQDLEAILHQREDSFTDEVEPNRDQKMPIKDGPAASNGALARPS